MLNYVCLDAILDNKFRQFGSALGRGVVILVDGWWRMALGNCCFATLQPCTWYPQVSTGFDVFLHGMTDWKDMKDLRTTDAQIFYLSNILKHPVFFHWPRCACCVCFGGYFCVHLSFCENSLGLALFCSCSWVPWRKSKSPAKRKRICWRDVSDIVGATKGGPGKVEIHGKAYRGFNRAGDENTETPPPIITVRPWKMVVGRFLFPFGKAYFEGRTVSFGQSISWGGRA